MRDLSFSEGMSTGYDRANAAIARGDKAKVFDWNKAAELIAQHKPHVAEAGLLGDWDCTGGEIFRHGKPITSDYTFLGSMWATPALRLTLEDGTHLQVECYTTENPLASKPEAKWPESALAILKNGEASK